jgi:hypothetical protein
MSKISIEEVESILQKQQLDPVTVKAIVKELNEVIEEIKGSKDPIAKGKWEHVIILQDKEGLLTGKEIAGWVVQQEVGEDAGTIIAKLQSAAADQNQMAKRKKSLISNLTSLFESMKTKFLKPKKLKIKTKELTRVIIVDGNQKEICNQLPPQE